MIHSRLLSKCCAMLLCIMLAAPCAVVASEPLQIIATIFPAYDFARVLAGETANVRMLLPPGSESHSYEPTPQDIIAIQNADLFIYTGGESDHWIEEILASMGDAAPRTLRMSDCVTLLSEEHTASMEHEHEHGEDCDHEHTVEEMDEHVWTSPRNVMLICRQLAALLNELDPVNSSVHDAALQAYLTELELLDQEFVSITSSGKRDLIIFGDRFPMRYFASAYGLRYDAAFPGCSEDSEPSVRTVISLVDTIRKQQIPVVFYIEFSSRRTADILAEETDATPLLFHSCHNVSAQEIADGASYLSLMWRNTEVLKEALN